jgi:integrase
VIEPSAREGYTYLLNRYLLPELGGMRMLEIQAADVRRCVTRLASVHGARPPTVRRCKQVLDAILATALNDQVTLRHAGKGVRTPPVATRPRRIISAEQFERIHTALGDAATQLLVETAIESGLRWGELTELRVSDVDFESGVLTVSRAVVELRARSLVPGTRFLVKQYPKDREWRRLPVAVLPRRGRRVPRRPSRDGTRSAAVTPTGHHRRPHQQRLVPEQHLAPGDRGSKPRLLRHTSRPAACSCVMAAGRGSGHPDSQRAAWSRQHHHDREVPARAAGLPGHGDRCARSCSRGDAAPRP